MTENACYVSYPQLQADRRDARRGPRAVSHVCRQMVHARIGTLVYGAAEPQTGAIVSTIRAGDLPGHNHRFEIVSGVREEECRALVQNFFKARR